MPAGLATEPADADSETGSDELAAADDVPDAALAPVAEDEAPVTGEAAAEEGREGGESAAASEEDLRNRRRGRRGGRRRRRDGDGEVSPFSVPGAEQPELPPVYAGPTPADPFGGRAFDIFDMMDQVEQAAEAKPAPRASAASEIMNNAEPEAEAHFVEPAAEEPVAAMEAAEAPVPAETQDAEPEIVNAAAPEPAAAALLETIEEPLGDIPEMVAANGLDKRAMPEPPEPAIKPILVGAGGEAPPEKKRGWWRR
jgi:ribonuclease E